MCSIWPRLSLFVKKCIPSGFVQYYLFCKKCVASGLVQHYLSSNVQRLALFYIICQEVCSIWPCSALFAKKCVAPGLDLHYLSICVKHLVLFSIIGREVCSILPCLASFAKNSKTPVASDLVQRCYLSRTFRILPYSVFMQHWSTWTLWNLTSLSISDLVSPNLAQFYSSKVQYVTRFCTLPTPK